MRRREFITILCGAAASWPVAAQAQQPETPIIGFLSSGSRVAWANFLDGFRRGLAETGFAVGQNVRLEERWSEGQPDRLPRLASELLGHPVAVLVAVGGSDPARAAMAASSSIPIVFVSAADPVTSGLVTSLSRPGGNVTGVSLLGSALEAKRLELLRGIVPNASTIAALIDPNYPAAKLQQREAEEAAALLGVKLIVETAGTESDIDAAFAIFVRHGAGAVLVAQDFYFSSRREQLIRLAQEHKLPTIYYQREFAAGGGLLSYGPQFADGYRQAGIYAGRILKGSKPADLPVTQPTKFELVINLKTARELGLTVSPSLLARADEVIE